MRDLPAEILTEIFLLLHQYDKMECMYVCHRWKQIVEDSALYHTVCIYSVGALDRLANKIQENSEIKTKIEQLMVFLGRERGASNLEKLLPLLPNMKTLLCSNWEEDRLAVAKEIHYPWHNHIQHISEHSDYGISFWLLSSGVCPHLTTLEISGLNRNIISVLKNAPALEYLVIVHASIILEDLECIHENLLYLKSLKLTYLNFQDSEVKRDFQPATTITECVFDLLPAMNTKGRIALLRYICKKYPNIYRLTYNFDMDKVVDGDIEKLNNLGWIPLFSSLGHQLKKLSIENGGYITNLFGTLDKYTTRLEYLKFSSLPRLEFAKIAQSNQMLHIQTLTLIHIELDTFTWLKELQSLKKMTIFWNYLRLNIKLNDILDHAPPSLKSLSFDFMDPIVDLDYTHSSHIETLSFNTATIPDNLDTFISRHFPKLTTLKLRNCNLIGTSFNLASMNLSSFHFTDQYPELTDTILVVSSDKQELHWYPVKGQNYKKIATQYFKSFHHHIYPSNYPSNRTLSPNNINSVPSFTLICNSVEKLVFT